MTVGIPDRRLFVRRYELRALVFLTNGVSYGLRKSKVVETLNHIKRTYA